MTGKRELTRRAEAYEEQLISHITTSATYFFITHSYADAGFRIQSLTAMNESPAELIASRDIDGTHSYVIKAVILPETREGISEERLESLEETLNNSLSEGFQDLVVVGRVDFSALQDKLPREITERIVYWQLKNGSSLAKISGQHNDPDLESYFVETKFTGMTDIFPLPYSIGLHPLIKFSLLSLNYSRKGKFSVNTLIDYTSEFAYRTSVSTPREEIREDFMNLLRTLEKTGLISVKGSSVYFPKNRERFEKAFHRKYWDYLERSQKVTLFDFERHF